MSAPDPHIVLTLGSMKGLEALNLKPEEAFVLTRVDGHSTLAQIASIVGFDLERTWSLLSRAVEAGVVKIGEAKAQPTARPKTADSVISILDKEDRDSKLSRLARALRLELRQRHEGLAEKNHYEVLHLEPRATAEQIKKAYLSHVKKLHPDRFFGKELGPYGKILEDLFEKVSRAYDELSQDARRRSYDRTLEKAKQSQEGDSEKREVKETKTKTFGNTLIERIALGKKQYAQGKTEEELGNFLAAANFYQVALQYEEKNETYRAALERVKPAVDRKRGDDLYQKGVEAIELGEARKARKLWEEAVALKTREKECYRDLTVLYRRLKTDWGKAQKVGEQALKFFPDDANLHATLGHIYMNLGAAERAENAFKAALRLEKGHADASAGLKELKRK